MLLFVSPSTAILLGALGLVVFCIYFLLTQTGAGGDTGRKNKPGLPVRTLTNLTMTSNKPDSTEQSERVSKRTSNTGFRYQYSWVPAYEATGFGGELPSAGVVSVESRVRSQESGVGGQESAISCQLEFPRS